MACPFLATTPVEFGDSDASGRSYSTGHGVGAVIESDAWARAFWPRVINTLGVAPCCGVIWRHKLCFLESCGHILTLMAFAEECLDRIIANQD